MISSEPQGLIEIYYAFIFIFGLCMGSFGNVVIGRLPEGLSVVSPRSRCPRCKTPIKAYDNIPVISWLILRARCRTCKNPISYRYPLVELLSGLLFLGLAIHLGISYFLIEACLFAWMGLVASFIDIDHRILPDVFTLTGIVLGLVGAAVNPERHFSDAAIGFVAGGGFLYAVAYIYMAVRNEEGMGGGDIKLIAWIGAVLGWRAVIFSILISSISGSIVGLTTAGFKKSGLKASIPFGPFLYFAAILYIFVGKGVMNWYLSVFFPFTGN